MHKVCTACTRTSFKIVPLTNLNKCDTSETEVNINTSVNNGSGKFYKRSDYRQANYSSICFCHLYFLYMSNESARAVMGKLFKEGAKGKEKNFRRANIIY